MAVPYDEDLSENPFIRILKQDHEKLFDQCVSHQWIVCVPRKDCVPNYAVTVEDFFEHIIRPNDSVSPEIFDLPARERRDSLPDDHVESECSSTSGYSSGPLSSDGLSLSEASCSNRSDTSPWNYKSLSGVRCEYRPNKFIRLDRSDCDDNSNAYTKTEVSILFEETFYTFRKKKYKLVCIEAPLRISESAESTAENELWELKSLRECIDFLWTKGKLGLLETYDAHIKFFLHNHSSLDSLPISIQRDLASSLYQKCIQIANSDPELTQSSSNVQTAVKIATETYVLNGVYRFLMGAITATLSFDDGQLNKVIRNLAEIRPEDLDIDAIHWYNLRQARYELGRLDIHTSPLAKLNCLKRTLQLLASDSSSRSVSNILSADQLLPIWLYLIVKTPLPNWNAQLQYVKNFRFSAGEHDDSEYEFLIANIEAALTHLRSGKVLRMVAGDNNFDNALDSTESWLHALNHAYDEPSDIRVAEMFSAIKIGNLARLLEVCSEYEDARSKHVAPKVVFVDPSTLCHPLCICETCLSLTAPPTFKELPPISVVCNDEGITLLHLACIYGRPKIVEYFISQNFPLDIADNQGLTALHHAASRGHQNALLLLLHAGASLESVDKIVRAPLHCASQNGHEACVKALIYYAEHSGKTLDLSPKDFNGNTPLHDAARWGFRGIVQILVEHGAAISVLNNRFLTPSDCAHDTLILRILQRSVRRRSLVSSTHGDFVNVEIMPKEEENSDNVVMLITEPQEKEEELPELKKFSGPQRRQRSFSTITSPSFNKPAEVKPQRVRRHTSILPQPTVENGLIIPENHPVLVSPSSFTITNVENVVEKRRVSLDESKRVRRISVESLDNISVSVVSDLPATIGEKIIHANQSRDMQKLMNAIMAKDVQLALFYLGIPVDELETVTSSDKIQRISRRQCHPLCPCKRCTSRNAGLGLDINSSSTDGLTVLHVAVQCGLTSLVCILYRYGADLNRRTSVGSTALKIARLNKHEEIIKFLLSKGAAE